MSDRFDDPQDPAAVAAPEATDWPDASAGPYGFQPGYGSFAPPALNPEDQFAAPPQAQPQQPAAGQQPPRVQWVKGSALFSQPPPPSPDDGSAVAPAADSAGQPRTNDDAQNKFGWDSFGNPPSVQDQPGGTVNRAGPDDTQAMAQDVQQRRKALVQAVPEVAKATGIDSAHAAVDAHFSEQYAAPAANVRKGWLNTGDYMDSAQALRAQIDQQKAQAHAALDDLDSRQQQLAAAQQQADATAAAARSVQTAAWQRQLAAARARGVEIPPIAGIDDAPAPAAPQGGGGNINAAAASGSAPAPASDDLVEAKNPGGGVAHFGRFDPSGPAYQATEDGALAFDPARLKQGLAEAYRDGRIDRAEFEKLAPQAQAAQAALAAQVKLLANDTVAAKLQAAGSGAGQDAAPGALNPGSNPAAQGADKLRRKLGEYADAVKAFTDATSTHPYYDTTGNLVAFGGGGSQADPNSAADSAPSPSPDSAAALAPDDVRNFIQSPEDRMRQDQEDREAAQRAMWTSRSADEQAQAAGEKLKSERARLRPQLPPAAALETDPGRAHASIDAHFNEEYAAPEANATTGWFGQGELTPEAAAMRRGIDTRKAQAHAAWDTIARDTAAVRQQQDAAAAHVQRTRDILDDLAGQGIEVPGARDFFPERSRANPQLQPPGDGPREIPPPKPLPPSVPRETPPAPAPVPPASPSTPPPAPARSPDNIPPQANSAPPQSNSAPPPNNPPAPDTASQPPDITPPNFGNILPSITLGPDGAVTLPDATDDGRRAIDGQGHLYRPPTGLSLPPAVADAGTSPVPRAWAHTLLDNLTPPTSTGFDTGAPDNSAPSDPAELERAAAARRAAERESADLSAQARDVDAGREGDEGLGTSHSGRVFQRTIGSGLAEKYQGVLQDMSPGMFTHWSDDQLRRGAADLQREIDNPQTSTSDRFYARLTQWHLRQALHWKNTIGDPNTLRQALTPNALAEAYKTDPARENTFGSTAARIGGNILPFTIEGLADPGLPLLLLLSQSSAQGGNEAVQRALDRGISNPEELERIRRQGAHDALQFTAATLPIYFAAGNGATALTSRFAPESRALTRGLIGTGLATTGNLAVSAGARAYQGGNIIPNAEEAFGDLFAGAGHGHGEFTRAKTLHSVLDNSHPTVQEYHRAANNPELPADVRAAAARIRDAAHAQARAELGLKTAPEPPAAIRTTADVLHEAKNVRLTTPKGARFIRVTDAEGRQSVEPIENVTKGVNPFQQAGPFQKVEAGVLNKKQQFVAARGDVTATDATKPAAEREGRIDAKIADTQGADPSAEGSTGWEASRGLGPLDDKTPNGGVAPGLSGSKLPSSFVRPRSIHDVIPALEAHRAWLDQRIAELDALSQRTDIPAAERHEAMNEWFRLENDALKAAQEIVALPVEQRGKVEVTNDIPSHLELPVKEGMRIMEAYVHPDLLPPVRVFAIPGYKAGGNPRLRSQYLAGDVFFEPEDTSKVVTHETTHGIEAEHPDVLAACQAFLMKRAAGQPPKRLAELTGIRDYRDEMAYEDEWEKLGGNAYSGKVGGNFTEILTMGLTRLHEDPLEFARKDPEYFLFVVKTLRKW